MESLKSLKSMKSDPVRQAAQNLDGKQTRQWATPKDVSSCFYEVVCTVWLEYEITSAWLNQSRKIQRSYLWRDLRGEGACQMDKQKNRSLGTASRSLLLQWGV